MVTDVASTLSIKCSAKDAIQRRRGTVKQELGDRFSQNALAQNAWRLLFA